MDKIPNYWQKLLTRNKNIELKENYKTNNRKNDKKEMIDDDPYINQYQVLKINRLID